jgi:hypothetical protein
MMTSSISQSYCHSITIQAERAAERAVATVGPAGPVGGEGMGTSHSF